MLAILGKLKAGSTEIGPTYKKCVEMWGDFLQSADQLSIEDLAEKLGDFQMEIEQACDMDRYLGKTIMPYAGLSYLYDDHAGFEDNRSLAEKLIKAFELSTVSTEVKDIAKKAAVVFDLYVP